MNPQSNIRKRIRHFNDAGHGHSLTFSCYGRFDLLNRDDFRVSFLSRLRDVREKLQFGLWAYVLMPNHVHLIVKPRTDTYDVSQFLRVLKSPVAFHALKALKSEGRTYPTFWKAGPGYDRNIYDVDSALQMIDYIHNNPVRKGLVTSPTDWRWSSARFWAGCHDVDLRLDEVV